MRRLAFLAVVAVVFSVRADDGCVVTHAPGCDATVLGQLAPGDCTLSSGQYRDVIEFPASIGQEFAVTVRPLSASFTNPLLTLSGPPPDASTKPAVVGGKYAALWFRATLTGPWRIGVGSTDLSAHGPYAVHIDCVPDEAPGLPPGCIIQDLACNQVGTWTLDATACQFEDGDPYHQWAVWGAEGDTLRFDMRGTGFAPRFWIYDGETVLKSSTNDGTRGAVMTYRVPETGWYWVVTSTREASGAGGPYQIEMSCAASGCLQPYFTAPMPDMTVTDAGATLSPSLDYYGGGGLTLELVDASNAGTYASSRTASVQAPAVTKPTRVFLRASNECGSNNSNVFTLRPEGTKRRTMRH
ncbi:MAG TPA: hypothetical protein VF432_33275 [Thermoanaerobaculia bacterium]